MQDQDHIDELLCVYISEITLVWIQRRKVERVTGSRHEVSITKCAAMRGSANVFVIFRVFRLRNCTLPVTVQSWLKAPIVTPKEIKDFGKPDTNNIFTEETIHFNFEKVNQKLKGKPVRLSLYLVIFRGEKFSVKFGKFGCLVCPRLVTDEGEF